MNLQEDLKDRFRHTSVWSWPALIQRILVLAGLGLACILIFVFAVIGVATKGVTGTLPGFGYLLRHGIGVLELEPAELILMLIVDALATGACWLIGAGLRHYYGSMLVFRWLVPYIVLAILLAFWVGRIGYYGDGGEFTAALSAFRTMVCVVPMCVGMYLGKRYIDKRQHRDTDEYEELDRQIAASYEERQAEVEAAQEVAASRALDADITEQESFRDLLEIALKLGKVQPDDHDLFTLRVRLRTLYRKRLSKGDEQRIAELTQKIAETHPLYDRKQY